MKKIIALCIVIVLASVFTFRCTQKIVFFNASDVNYIEVFTGSVPVAAYKKTVDRECDIARIIEGLNELTIRKALFFDSIGLSGGIGTAFSFYLTNGDHIVIWDCSNAIRTGKGPYKIVFGQSLDSDDFWDSLDYEAVLVGQSGLPKI